MSDSYYKALGEIVKLTHENTELREELKARELDVKAHAVRRAAAEQRNLDADKVFNYLMRVDSNHVRDILEICNE